MAKGFIKGALWGACVSLGAVTLLSVAVDGPRSSETLAASATPGTNQQPVALDPGPDATVGLPAPATSPDTLAVLAPDVDAPAAVPVTGVVTALADTEYLEPKADEGLAGVNQPAPRLGAAQSGSLTTPLSDPEASISTDPAQPPAPSAVVPQSAFDEPEVASVEVSDESPELLASVSSDVSDLPTQPQAPEEASDADDPSLVLSFTVQEVATSESNEVETPENTQVADIAVSNSPAAMTQAPALDETDEDLKEEVFAALAPAETSQPAAIDAVPPRVVTDVVQPLSKAGVELDTVAPEVAGEADAPQVVGIADIYISAPENKDISQTPGESETAAVRAEVTTAAAPATPETLPAPAPSVPVAEAEVETPSAAPEVLAQVAPDPVATPDLAQFVASEEAATNDRATVRINRLPSLGQDPEEAPSPEAVPSEESESTGEAATVEDVAPFVRNAETFENPDDKPAMAIVLMDQGEDLNAAKIGLPALRSFPYPLTFAVDAMLPDAADRIAAYRAEGFEVLATVDLPEGATAADAEVNMSVALQRVPGVVGVLEGVNTGVQTTRDSGRQVAQILAQSGHGFVTQNVGLNTVQKLAARDGVPSAFVFRDFDSKGQTPTVIRRFLDQAAFKAGQEGGVVMLGRLREETISALLVWGLQDRASRVALAPVSAVLKPEL